MEKFFVGVDLGGTRIKIGLVADEKVIAQKIIPAHASEGLNANLPRLKNEIDSLIYEQGLTASAMSGLGITFPGIVDTVTKKILYTNKKFDDGPSLDLEKWTNDNWSVPFFIDNDARMAAAGEWKFGAGKGTDDLVMMTIGTGIGTAAVIEGKLLRGKHFQAGILGGHFAIQYEGGKCICGNKGCAELYGGSWPLEKRITQHALHKDSMFSKMAEYDFSAVFGYAAQKDQLAEIILEQCIEVWAATLGNLILAYDPEVVVLGGGVLKSADIILPALRERIAKLSWMPWGKVDVRPCLLHEDAAILGLAHFLQQMN